MHLEEVGERSVPCGVEGCGQDMHAYGGVRWSEVRLSEIEEAAMAGKDVELVEACSTEDGESNAQSIMVPARLAAIKERLEAKGIDPIIEDSRAYTIDYGDGVDDMCGDFGVFMAKNLTATFILWDVRRVPDPDGRKKWILEKVPLAVAVVEHYGDADEELVDHHAIRTDAEREAVCLLIHESGRFP